MRMARNLIIYFVCVMSLYVGCNARYLFIFGDSLYDPGNNFISDPNNTGSAHCPYGMTHFHYPTGRFSDGRVLPDFIAHNYAGLPIIPPYQNGSADFSHGASFASAGAGVLDDHPPPAMNLRGQYANFSKLATSWSANLGPEEANERLKQAVYLFSMGGNDYFTISGQSNTSFSEMQDYVSLVIGNLSQVVKEMYDNQGARKFMFQNVGPLGCLPIMKQKLNITGNGCAEVPMTLATLHNDALSKMVVSIKSSREYSEFTYSIFDFFSALRERIRDPTSHGFKVGDTPCYDRRNNGGDNGGTNGKSTARDTHCTDVLPNPDPPKACSNPTQYVFFDDGHNTDAANRQFADLMWGGGPEAVCPYTIKQLFDM